MNEWTVVNRGKKKAKAHNIGSSQTPSNANLPPIILEARTFLKGEVDRPHNINQYLQWILTQPSFTNGYSQLLGAMNTSLSIDSWDLRIYGLGSPTRNYSSANQFMWLLGFMNHNGIKAKIRNAAAFDPIFNDDDCQVCLKVLPFLPSRL